MTYKLMVVDATEKNRDLFIEMIQQIDETPTHVLINDTDTVAKEWALAHDIQVVETVPSFEEDGRSALYKDTSERISLADSVLLLWDGKTKKGQDILNKATKAQIEIYRN